MTVDAIGMVRMEGMLVLTFREGLTEEAILWARHQIGAALSGDDLLGLVLDMSGVQTMDSFITRGSRDLAVTARLMGVHTVICGLRPDVAITLVDMGMELSGVPTALSPDHAVRLLRRGAAAGARSRG